MSTILEYFSTGSEEAQSVSVKTVVTGWSLENSKIAWIVMIGINSKFTSSLSQWSVLATTQSTLSMNFSPMSVPEV